MRRRGYVQLEDVRPKVIALLQHYGPTDVVAEVAGVRHATITGIYSRSDYLITWAAYDKIDEAYKKNLVTAATITRKQIDTP